MKLPFFVKQKEIREFKFLFITNLLEDKKQNLVLPTVNEYLNIYPKYFKNYEIIEEFKDGKRASNEFVYLVKPKKATKHEFVVIKRKDLNPNIEKNHKEMEKEVIYFIKH